MENQLQKGVDFTGVSMIYFCHDGKGNFLMAKRSQNARDEHGKWDIGGGALDFGSSVEEALKKEIKEEYCTDVLSYEFLGFRDVHREIQLDTGLSWKLRLSWKLTEVNFVHLDQFRPSISVVPLRKKTHWIALDFKVLVDPAKIRNGEPHKFDEICWFTFDSFPENLHSTVPVIFEKYKEKLKAK